MEHIQIGAQVLFHVGPLPVTNSIFSAWVTMVVLVVAALFATRKMELAPKGFQNFVEYVVELLLGICESTAGRKRGRQFLPIVATSFLFILVSNWMGLLPGYGDTPWLRSSDSDLNVTAAMAIIVFVVAQWVSISANGPLGYLKEFVVPNPLHLLSEVAKPLTLAFRLFGNIFSGEVLIVTMGGLIPLAFPSIFYGFELFVGIIQAIIFSMLTLVYFSMGTLHDRQENPH